MRKQQHATGWCCVDCLMLLANGETSPHWSEEETAEYLARVESHSGNEEITLGLMMGDDHCDCDEEMIEAHDYDAHSQCEEIEFSSRQCDVCGSHLAGSRHAVTFWWPTHENWNAAGKDASLGVGHCWTETKCPAYQTLDAKDCVCQKVSL